MDQACRDPILHDVRRRCHEPCLIKFFFASTRSYDSQFSTIHILHHRFFSLSRERSTERGQVRRRTLTTPSRRPRRSTGTAPKCQAVTSPPLTATCKKEKKSAPVLAASRRSTLSNHPKDPRLLGRKMQRTKSAKRKNSHVPFIVSTSSSLVEFSSIGKKNETKMEGKCSRPFKLVSCNGSSLGSHFFSVTYHHYLSIKRSLITLPNKRTSGE